jgi:hypothetical protein
MAMSVDPNERAASVWEISGIRAPAPAVPMLAELVPSATVLVAAGSGIVWFGLADPTALPEADTAGTSIAPVAGSGEGLPFSSGTLGRLMLAAQAGGEAAFCDELRIYDGQELLLRWTAPVAGTLRIAPGVPERVIWRYAAMTSATYRRCRGPL